MLRNMKKCMISNEVGWKMNGNITEIQNTQNAIKERVNETSVSFKMTT